MHSYSTTRIGSAAHRSTRRRAVSPPRIIVMSFGIAILLGALLLMLPAASKDGESIGFVDALFTSTSATCVTGLIVLDTGSHFSRFGQVVIISLVQAGGLGIMTMSTSFLLLLGRRLSFREHVVVQNAIAKGKIGSLRVLVKYVILFTFTFEFIGAVVLYLRLKEVADLTPYQAFYHGAFHSISAFCNAGFSLYSDSLFGFRKDGVILLTMTGLIIAGGLGFVVLYNLISFRFWRRSRPARGKLSLQTRVVLITSAVLTALMGLCFLGLEWDRTLEGFSFADKMLNTFFHAVTPRTAGFNTLPVSAMSNPVLFVTMIMMFIGASPGSTGGGIKTCTLAVLIATSRAIVGGRGEVRLMKRALSNKVVKEAICVALFAMAVVLVVGTLLLITEKELVIYTAEKGHLMKLLFETVSAFGTVGLSTGVTPSLTTWGRLLISLTMFTGRLGPLTLALIIARKGTRALVHYPEEDVMIG